MKAVRRLHILTLTLITALVVAMVPALTAIAAGGSISYGDMVTGNLTNKSYYDLWEFQGQKGDLVQITMIGADGLDAYVGLVNTQSGSVLAEDDDSAGGSDAYLEMILPASGSYTIVATRYDLDTGTSQGSYTLQLLDGNSPQTTNVSAGGEAEEVEPGVFYLGMLTPEEPVYGTIEDAAYAHLYEVEVTQGDMLHVGMFADGSDLDPYLFVADEAGDFLAEDDDSGYMVEGDTLDSYVSLTVPSTGTYVIVATRSGVTTGFSAGDYVLMAMIEAPGESDPAVVEEDPQEGMPEGTAYYGDLVPGTPVTGDLDDAIYIDVYTFEGKAGQMVTITMVGDGSLDSYLGLMDPADEIIAEDDDSGGDMDAQIAIELPTSGEYLVLAARNDLDSGTTSGSYTLTIAEGAPQPEEETQTGMTGFGGLPGRALESDAGTVYLRGFGSSDSPEKNTPIEGYLSSQPALPGRGGRLGSGLRPGAPPSISLNFEEIKVT